MVQPQALLRFAHGEATEHREVTGGYGIVEGDDLGSFQAVWPPIAVEDRVSVSKDVAAPVHRVSVHQGQQVTVFVAD